MLLEELTPQPRADRGAGARELQRRWPTPAREIAAGNADLSQRTEEQASTLEETAASMEELTATVTQNAETRARRAAGGSARRGRAQGGDVVDEVVDTMGGINARREDRRHHRRDRRHRLPDQHPGAERRGGGGARGRAGPRLRGGRRRGAQPRAAQRRGGQEIKVLIADRSAGRRDGGRLVDEAGQHDGGRSSAR